MKLNIGLFNDSFPPTIDGVANCVLNYATIIGKNYGKSCVVTPKYPNVVDDYDFEVYRYFSIPVEQLFGYRAGDPFSPFTIKDIRDKKFDIIHVHAPFVSSILANQVCLGRHRVPIVFTYHTKFDIDLAKRVKVLPIRKIASWLVTYNIKAADEVWVVSEGAVKSLREMGYKGDYLIMPNGTDFKKGIAAKDQIEEVEKAHNIAKDELVFLFVGRMMWYKNIRFIIDSLKILKEKDLKFRMIFVGDGVDKPDIEKYVKKLGLSDCVHFAGSICDREKVRSYFSRSNLFLFPSTYDTSGLVVTEAAACSCPSLLIRGSCASEGVKDKFSGYLCEEDTKDCAKVILEAVSDREKLKAVGVNASENLYISWDDAVQKAYSRYEEIIKNWKHPKLRKKKGNETDE